jgi:hypothetical protein
LPIGNYSDGLHHLTLSSFVGDETTATASQTTTFVKRTRDARLRLKGLIESVSLASQAGPIEAMEAWFQGKGIEAPVQFRVGERVVETLDKPPFRFAVDPKSLGVGRHFLRARTTSPVQEADDEIELHIDP